MRGSNFVFENVNLLFYRIHKISFNRRGSYIDSPDWIKHEKATTNPKSKDNKCFGDAITAELNHKRNKRNPKGISGLKPFFDQYNWKNIELISNLKSFFDQYNWKNIELISNLKSFFDQCHWKDIEFPSHSKDWKKFEQNNKKIVLNIVFVTQY